MSQPVGVCCLVINNKNEILLGKRKNNYKAGTFGLPGGRLEGNESLVDACKREVIEETGLTAHTLKYIGVVREWQEHNKWNFIHFVFVCKAFEGTVTLQEPEKCEGWEWYSLDNLPSPLLPGHKAAIEMYMGKNNSESLLSDIH